MAPLKKTPRKSVPTKSKDLKRKSLSVRVTARVKGGGVKRQCTNDDSI